MFVAVVPRFHFVTIATPDIKPHVVAEFKYRDGGGAAGAAIGYGLETGHEPVFEAVWAIDTHTGRTVVPIGRVSCPFDVPSDFAFGDFVAKFVKAP